MNGNNKRPKSSKFLNAYADFVRKSDSQRTALWGWTARANFKLDAMKAAAKVAPAEAEVFSWYARYFSSQSKGAVPGELQALYTPEREEQGKALMNGISAIWKTAEYRQVQKKAASAARKAARRKAASAEAQPEVEIIEIITPEPVEEISAAENTTEQFYAWMNEPFDDEISVPALQSIMPRVVSGANGASDTATIHVNGNGDQMPLSVSSVSDIINGTTAAYLAYERAANELSVIPPDSTIAPLVGCGTIALTDARRRLTAAGYGFVALEDGSYQVTQRPFDRQRVHRDVLRAITAMSDDEMKTLAEVLGVSV